MADIFALSVEEEEDEKKKDIFAVPPASEEAGINYNFSEDFDPDVEARRYDLADKSGNTLNMVREHEDQIKHQVEAPDFEGRAKDAPKTVDFFGLPENMAISKDDFEGLVAIERSKNLGWWEKTKLANKAGQHVVVGGRLYSQELFNVLADKEDQTLTDRIAAFEAQRVTSPEDKNFFESVVTGTAEMIPIVGEMIREGAETGATYAVAGAAGALVVGQLGPQVLLPEEAITVPVAATVMWGAGTRIGAAQAMFQLEAGNAFSEIKAFKDESGEFIDPKVAAAASIGVGGINAGLEFVGLKLLAKTIPGGSKLMGRLTMQAARKALQNPAIRDALLAVAARYGTAVGGEAMTEMAQEVVAILGGEIAKGIAGAKDDVDFEAIDVEQEVIPRILESGYEAAVATIGLGFPGSAYSAATAPGRVKRQTQINTIKLANDSIESDAFQEEQAEINEAVNASKTKERSPLKTKEFLDHIGEGEDVYLTPEGFDTLLQSDKGPEVFERLGVDTVAAQEASAAGQDIKIPLSSVHAFLEADEFKALAPDLKPAPAAMSARELEALDLGFEAENLIKLQKEVAQEQKDFGEELKRLKDEALAAGNLPDYVEQHSQLLERFANRMAIEGKERVDFLKKVSIRSDQTFVDLQAELHPPPAPGTFTLGQESAEGRELLASVRNEQWDQVEQAVGEAISSGLTANEILHNTLNPLMAEAADMPKEQRKALGIKMSRLRHIVAEQAFPKVTDVGTQVRNLQPENQDIEELTVATLDMFEQDSFKSRKVYRIKKDLAIQLLRDAVAENPDDFTSRLYRGMEANQIEEGAVPLAARREHDGQKAVWLTTDIHSADDYASVASERATGEAGGEVLVSIPISGLPEYVYMQNASRLPGAPTQYYVGLPGDLDVSQADIIDLTPFREDGTIVIKENIYAKPETDIAVRAVPGARRVAPGAVRPEGQRDVPQFTEFDLAPDLPRADPGRAGARYGGGPAERGAGRVGRFSLGDTVHDMPDGSVMAGPEHAEAVEGSERPATQADVDTTETLLQEGLAGEADPAALEAKYPEVSEGTVSGLDVLSDVPNRASIPASFNDFTELKGVRELPFSDFGDPQNVFYAADDKQRSRELAGEISASGEVKPLIIAIDAEGPYILEGAHRFVALSELGHKTFPAVVVIDEDVRQDPSILRQEAVPVWFSALQKQLASDKFAGKGTGTAYAATLKGWTKKGILKAEEVEWSGVIDWLEAMGKEKVSREEVLEFVQANGVQVDEVVLSSQERLSDQWSDDIDGGSTEEGEYIYWQWSDIDRIQVRQYEDTFDIYEDGVFVEAFESFVLAKNKAEDIIREDFPQVLDDTDVGGTKFSDQVLPGGENYKEILLTLPPVIRKKEVVVPAEEALSEEETLELAGMVKEAEEKTGKSRGQIGSGELRAAGFDQTFISRWYDLIVKDIRRGVRPESTVRVEEEVVEERTFTGSHFDDPNVIAHVRFNERTDAEGDKVLFIEEIQSDWHQAGRKGGYIRPFVVIKPGELNVRRTGTEASGFSFIAEVNGEEVDQFSMTSIAKQIRNVLGDTNTPELRAAYKNETHIKEAVLEIMNANRLRRSTTGVPDAPFKKSWPQLALKRMVRYAAENGFAKIAWTTGEQQADRYDLSKQVDEITYSRVLDKFNIKIYKDDSLILSKDDLNISELEEFVGKEVAQKMVEREGGEGATRSLSGLDLKVGGEGMKAFYDKMLPSAAKKLFGKKAWGSAEIEDISIKVGRAESAAGITEFEIWMKQQGHPEPPADQWATDGFRVDEFFAAKRDLQVEVHSLEITPEMKEKALTEGLPLFQAKQKGPRGALSFANNEYLISLFERADLSTLFHETGHLFFAEMDSLIRSGTASQAFQKDFNTLTTWLGAEEGKPLTVSQKEKFARGFEAYLLEGKAPSADLAAAFERFKKWLSNVYKSVVDLDVELTDEVRGVFDRLLASEQDIADAATLDDMTLLSKEQMDQLGIVPEDRAYMARLIKEAQDNAEKRMVKDRNKDRKKNMKGWKAEAKKEVEAMPVYVALAALTKGEGLDREVLQNSYGEDIVAKIPKNAIKKDGTNLEWAAYAYEFENVDDMVKALAEAPPKQETINIRVQARSDAHDSQFQPNDYLSDTKEYAEYLFVKAKYLGRGGKAADILPRQAFKLHANKILSAMPVRDAQRHDRFLAAMRKYSKLEGEKIRLDKLAEAADANEKVRLNYEMAGQAVRNRKEVARIIKKAKRSADSKTINPDYRENILAVIERFELGTERMVPQRPEEKTPLANLLSDVDGAVDQVAFFSEWILNEAYRKDYKDLAMTDMEELGQLIDYLTGKGRDAHKAMLADGRTTVEEAAQAIAAEVSTIPKKRIFDRVSVLRKMTSGIRKYFAMMDSFNFIAIALGGYKNIGKKGVKSQAEKLTSDTLVEAQTQKDLLNEKINARIEPDLMQLMRTVDKLVKKHGRRMRIDGATVPQLLQEDGQDGWWTPEQVLAIALNMGNEGNVQRLYSGYEGLTPSTVTNLLDLLTKEDWDAVQGLWDSIDSLFKDTDAVNFKLNFFHLNKIEAKPLKTKFGMYKGGYYPARYDGGLLGKEAQRISAFTEKEDLMSRTEAMFQVPATKSGMLKERNDKVMLPLKLSLNVATEHLRDTVQYITHAEAVRDIDRILRHKDVVKPIQEALGREVYDMIRPALKHIARPQRDYPSFVDKTVDTLRGLTTPFILAWNAGVAFKQWFSSPAVMFEIGVKDFFNGYAEAFFRGSPIANFEQMKEMSPYIRQRVHAMDRELQGMFQKMRPDQKTYFFGDKAISWQDVRNFGFWPIRLVDMLAVMPVWKGSYVKAMRENGGDVDAAVKFADGIVRKTQPSAQPLDMSQWQYAGGAVRLFSMFQTFTVGKYGQRQRLHYRAWRAKAISNTDYAWFNFVDAVLPALGMNILFSLLWDKDLDDDDTWKEIGVNILKYWFLTGLPIISDLWSPYGIMESPTKVVMEETKRTVTTGNDFIQDMNQENIEKVMWQLFRMGSLISKVPVSRVVDKAIKGSEQGGDNPLRYVVPRPKNQ